MSSCELYDNIVLHTNFSLFVRIISTIADGEEKPEVQCFLEDKMSVQLLDKTRKINKLLHNNNSSKVVFNDICEVLTEILLSNVLVVSKKGKVLGVSACPGVPEIKELLKGEVGGHIDEMLNERLLNILSTKENVNLQTLGFTPEIVKGYQAIITPIDIAGERLGSLFIYKKDALYEIDDIILSEYNSRGT